MSNKINLFRPEVLGHTHHSAFQRQISPDFLGQSQLFPPVVQNLRLNFAGVSGFLRQSQQPNTPHVIRSCRVGGESDLEVGVGIPAQRRKGPGPWVVGGGGLPR